jgi:alkylation response protein AidB-like acyl-CoA dehydrogenase
MDFEFTEEERSVSDLARKILEDFVTNERLKSLEANGDAFADEAWHALAESNLLGVAIPEAQGGMDLGFTALCLLCQEVGRTVAPLPVYASLVLGALPLAARGSEADKLEWLPRIASGESILTAALTELDSTDPTKPTTRAERTTNGFSLTGEKTLVPAGLQAARILVSASTDDGPGLFWITPGAKGVRLEAQDSSDGQPYAYLALQGAEVSEAAVLGSIGDDTLRWLVERAIVARCAMQLGVTERALEMTAEYGRERVQFDVAIGSFQAFHQRAADAYIGIEAIRLTTWEAALSLAEDEPADECVAVAKYWASEAGALAAYACQHLHGGIGIDVDYPLHRYFIWSSQIEHTLGGAQAQLADMGARIAVTGIPAS